MSTAFTPFQCVPCSVANHCGGCLCCGAYNPLEAEALGRACYEGFHAQMADWLPPAMVTDWSLLPDLLKRGWIAGAKAAKKVSV